MPKGVDDYGGVWSAGDLYARAHPGEYSEQRLQEGIDHPDWEKTWGSDWRNATALDNSFQQLYGRKPTQGEVNSLFPFYNADPNLGNAYLQQYYQQSPEYQNKNVPAQTGNVQEIFKSVLGREANQDELSHFGQLLGTRQADPYTLAQYLKATPEYQNAQDTQFRSGLNTELQGYDQSFFKRAKEDVISRYAQMGRPTSPALDVALTDLQAQINERRGQFLAQTASQQYAGNKQNAFSDYQNQQGQWYQNQNQNRQMTQDIWNHGVQQNDFQNQLALYQRYGGGGKGGMNPLSGAMSGAMAGSAGGPWGALIGAGAGAGLAYLNQ